MKSRIDSLLNRALEHFPKRRVFKGRDAEFEVHELLDFVSWRPAERTCDVADAMVFASDPCGNSFLYLTDGTAAFWDHETNEVTVLCDTLEEFCLSLVEPDSTELAPDQVISAWIDPSFFEELRRTGEI